MKKTPNKKKDIKIEIFYLIIFFWIILSFFDVFYNSVKFFYDAKHWLPLSDYQKRHEVYGEIYDFLVFIGKNTDTKSSILIYSKDDKAYYLGRNYLYPRRIQVINKAKELGNVLNIGKYKYLALDNLYFKSNDFKIVASMSAWIIYKHL